MTPPPGYLDFLNKELRRVDSVLYEKRRRRQRFTVISMLLVIMMGALFFSQERLTGYFLTVENISSSVQLGMVFNTSSDHTLILDGQPTSIRVSGTVIGDGIARLYAVTDSQRVLVLDSAQLPGRNAFWEDAGSTPSTPTPGPAPPSYITIWLDYNSGTAWDPDNDGIETEDRIIDFSVSKTEFNWSVDETGLCTRWEILSQDTGEGSYVCYGSERCCNFLGLDPLFDSWDEPYNCFIGRHSATEDTEVSAQVVYVGTLGEVQNSTWQGLSATFIPPPTVDAFSLYCLDSCRTSLEDVITLEVELEGARLNISEIAYTYLVEATDGFDPDRSLAELNLEFAGQDFLFTNLTNTTTGFRLWASADDASITFDVDNLSAIRSLQLEEIDGEVYGSWELGTPAIAVDAVASAGITLPKTRYVDAIISCPDWDFGSRSCEEWALTTLPFDQDADSISFSVPGFSAYAGRYADSAMTIVDSTDDSITSFTLNLSDTTTWQPLNASCNMTVQGETAEMDFDGTLYHSSTAADGQIRFDCLSPDMSRMLSETVDISFDSPVQPDLTQQPARVGEPVVWQKKIIREGNASEIRIPIPWVLENVSITFDNSTHTNISLPVDQVKVNLSSGLENLTWITSHAERNRISRGIKDLEKLLGSEKDKARKNDLNNEIRSLKSQRNSITGAVVGGGDNWLVRLLSGVGITGFAVAGIESQAINLTDQELSSYGFFNFTELVITDPPDELILTFETPPAEKSEANISEYKKGIVISSEYHYTNITAFTTLPEATAASIKLYRTTNGTRERVSGFTKIDTNNNSLIDYIEWVVPHLSNESYEVEITILDLHSQPQVGSNWTVRFNTTGVANLTIYGFDGTTYGNSSPDDLEFLELRCGNVTLTPEFNGSHIFQQDFNCSGLGYHTVRVHTPGTHSQRFEYGAASGEAFNSAGDPAVNLSSPPDGSADHGADFALMCNVTDDEDIINLTLWTNISGSWVAMHTIWPHRVVNESGIIFFAPLDGSSTLADGEAATLEEGVTWVNGTVGKAAYFQTGVVTNLHYGVTDNINFTTGSFEAWVRRSQPITDIPLTNYPRVMGAVYDGDNNIFIQANPTNELLYLRFEGNNDPDSISYGANVLTPSKWHHLAATWNTTSRVARIYLDGKYVAQSTSITDMVNLPTVLEIGELTGDGEWNGSIDEVILYKKVLSDNEVSAHYNVTFKPNSTVIHTFPLTGISEGVYAWNCLAYDNKSQYDWANDNFTMRVGSANMAPTTKLNSPPNATVDGDGSMFFSCNVTDDAKIVNVSIFTNITGEWLLNTTSYPLDFNGSDDVLFMAHMNNDSDSEEGESAYREYNITWVDGISGKAANFTKKSNLTYNAPGNFNHTNGSVSVWIKPSWEPDDGASHIIFANYHDPSNYFWMGKYSDDFLYFMIQGSAYRGPLVAATSVLAKDTWSNIVGTWNSTKVELWVDGNMISSDGTSSTLPPSDEYIAVGYEADETSWGPGDFMGAIDELIIFDHFLSPDEIKHLYNRTQGLTAANETFNLSDMPEGEFLWNCEAFDSGGKSDFGDKNWTVFIDKSPPIMTYVPATEANYTNWSDRDWVYVNLSITDLSNVNLTFWLYNISDGALNLLSHEATAVGDTDKNFTGLKRNNWYYYNVTGEDAYGNINITPSRWIFLDDPCVHEDWEYDWRVNKTCTVSNKVINLNGDLLIGQTANLSFVNVTLLINQTSNFENEIIVYSGGMFNITASSNVTPKNESIKAAFFVERGAALRISSSQLRSIGNDSNDMTKRGLYINGSLDAFNATFKDVFNIIVYADWPNITDCSINGSLGAEAGISVFAKRANISSNVISGIKNSTTACYGIFVAGPNATIMDNNISSVGATAANGLSVGIHLENSSGSLITGNAISYLGDPAGKTEVRGISLDRVNKSYVKNHDFTLLDWTRSISNSYAVHMLNCTGIVVADLNTNLVNITDRTGIYSDYSMNITVQNSTLVGLERGIDATRGSIWASHNTFRNISDSAVKLSVIKGSLISDSVFGNMSPASAVRLVISHNNSFVNLSIGGSFKSFDFQSESCENSIVDSNFSHTTENTVFGNELVMGPGYCNNTIINSNFSSSNFAFNEGGGYYRFAVKWPIKVYVNEINGTQVPGAVITAVSKTNSLSAAAMAGSNGWTAIMNLTEYIRSSTGSTTELPWNITASKPYYVTRMNQFSFSTGNTTTITLVPNPQVNLSFPQMSSDHNDNPMNFICNVSDDVNIVNITLYVNSTGGWLPNQTKWVHRVNDSNITFYAPFDGSTTDLVDGETPTAETGLSYEYGKINRGLFFGTGDNLQYNAAGNINFTHGTVEFWIRLNRSWADYPTTSWSKAFEFQRVSAANWFFVGIHPTASYIYAHWEGDGTGRTVQIADSVALPPYEWHHIAVTWNETSTTMKAYFDGKNVGQDTNIVAMAEYPTTFRIGGASSNNQELNGSIDEFVIYNKVFSDSEVQAHFNTTNNSINQVKATFNITGLPDNHYKWNCLAWNDRPAYSWAAQNWTVRYDRAGPTISSVSHEPDNEGYGRNVTIKATVTDAGAGVEWVWASITSPIGPESNYTMRSQGSNIYAYNYSNWTKGEYTYRIFANDSINPLATGVAADPNFLINANLTINITTNRTTYGMNKIVYLEEYGPNQSRINNTGMTNTSYYILAKTQYYNSGAWVDEDVVIDDVQAFTTRTLNKFSEFQVDTLWNGRKYNTSNLSSGGVYRVIFNATDPGGVTLLDQLGANVWASHNFTYDNAVPYNITIFEPINYSFTNITLINFNWSVMDTQSRNLTCNLTADSKVNASGIICPNATAINQTVPDFLEGNHSWQLKCWDEGDNAVTSGTYYFYVDTSAPVINLNSPGNATWHNTNQMTFNYSADDPNIDTCILYGNFNASWISNATNSTMWDDVPDSVTIGLKNGTYIWNVWCNDTFAKSAWNSTNFTFMIDTSKPDIQLLYPKGNWSNESWINFNWTVQDIIDSATTCNLTINSTVNESGISANNATPTNFTVLGFEDGFRYWNITCWDAANHSNTSETYNFTVDAHWPAWSNQEDNTTPTEPMIGSRIQLNVTLTDILGLDWYIFSWNHSGSWVNYTPIGMSGTSFIVQYNVTFNSTGRINVSWRLHFNDTIGHMNQTRIFGIQMRNTPPTNATPTLNSTDGTNLTNQDLNCFDTLLDADNDTINVTVQWYKDGVPDYARDYNTTYMNGSYFNAVLASTNTSVGETWICGMRSWDQGNFSEWVNSTGIDIIDDIYNCTVLDYPGFYSLKNDILNEVKVTCMNITSGNVTLDCESHLIDGQGGAAKYGIISDGNPTSPLSNVTILNCRLDDWGYGIYLKNTNYSLVNNTNATGNTFGLYLNYVDNTVFSYLNVSASTGDGVTSNNAYHNNHSYILSQSSGSEGIVFFGSDFNRIEDSIFSGHVGTSDYGIHLNTYSDNNVFIRNNISDNFKGIYFSTSNQNNNFTGNRIFNNSMLGVDSGTTVSTGNPSWFWNNLFNNTNNTYVKKEAGYNYWNTTKVSDTNIIGGSWMGGNYWCNYTDGEGYSDNCTDMDRDGICDIPFSLDGTNYDYLALTYPGPNVAPNTPVVTINSSYGTNLSSDDLNCIATLDDPNGEAMNVSVRWYKDDVPDLLIHFNSSYANGTAFVGPLSYTNTSLGEKWTCGMRFWDGAAWSGWANASTNITLINNVTACTLIREPGYYRLMNSISNSAAKACINITSRDVEFDCRSYIIDGVSDNNWGVSAEGREGSELGNVTLERCAMTDWSVALRYKYVDNGTVKDSNATSNSYGIILYSGNNLMIVNNSILDNARGIGLSNTDNSTLENCSAAHGTSKSYFGIQVANSDYNKIINNTVYHNYYNLELSGDSIYNNITGNTIVNSTFFGVQYTHPNIDNNIFWNNFLNNTYNFNVANTALNFWNSTNTTGTNIIGRTNIGGNYWANYSGSGYSDTCSDADEDGFCDTPYTINSSSNKDYLPLTVPGATPPVVNLDKPLNDTWLQAGT
ncbi:MAG: right-handed parallel beta-helix repeat-containing protein, partial [Nanoarchaeota archaeon]|nr:right-handed parallel beta-helix repeat-containing protein [Nanoarchaeota archaeon]